MILRFLIISLLLIGCGSTNIIKDQSGIPEDAPNVFWGARGVKPSSITNLWKKYDWVILDQDLYSQLN